MLPGWMLGFEDQVAVTLSKLAELWTSDGSRERSEMRSVHILTVSLKSLARLCR